MANTRGHSESGQPDPKKNLPDLSDSIPECETSIFVFPNSRLCFSRLSMTDPAEPGDRELRHEMLAGSCGNGISDFIRRYYERLSVKTGHTVIRVGRPAYRVDNVDKAARFICDTIDEEKTVRLLREAYVNVLDILKMKGMDVPEDPFPNQQKVLSYFRKGTVKRVDAATGETVYDLPPAGGLKEIDELTKYESVKIALADVSRKLNTIASAAVCTGLHEYLCSIHGKETPRTAVENDISAAADAQRAEITAHLSEVKVQKAAYMALSGDLTDYEIVSRCMMRVRTKALRVLLGVAPVLYTAAQKGKTPDFKKIRTRAEIFDSRCDLTSFFEEMISKGITGQELLDWTVIMMAEVLDVYVPKMTYDKLQRRLEDEKILNTSILAVFPLEWKQKAKKKETIDAAYIEFIQTQVSRSRKRLLAPFYGFTDSSSQENPGKNSKEKTDDCGGADAGQEI